jgi:hypothetical protein
MFLLLLVALQTVPTAEPTDSLFAFHLQHYPSMTVQDVYKLLYQGTFGPEHFMHDLDAAREYLKTEMADLNDPAPGEQLYEPVSPREDLVRVNLRLYRKSGYPPEALLTAMSESRVNADTILFMQRWKAFIAWATSHRFDRSDLHLWAERITPRNLPVVHHSALYERTYHPAYRVCNRQVLEHLLVAAGGGGE